MKDPAFQKPDTFAGSGGSWLSRTAIRNGQPLPPDSMVRVPDWVTDLTRLP
jgi:hypothetical protein